uniref:Interleukin-13 receptor subunit alpha-1-like n=1 Tax=Labrus bergylta TaxID=56723 RepID=A0A3Q3KXI9_9LABR
MTFHMDFFIAFLTCAAVTLVLPNWPPPPTRLKYEWIDQFTVNVSWEKPRGVQDGSEVTYKYRLVKNGEDVTCTTVRNFTVPCLTEETDSDGYTYNVWTDSSPNCRSSTGESTRVNITVKYLKSRAKVVKDFKCVIHGNETDCSWIPVDPSLKLNLSYRMCGCSEEVLKSLKKCHELHRNETRTGCHLKVNAIKGDICILVETDAAMSTFIAEPEVPSPKMSVREVGDHLKLSWKPPEVGKQCTWLYDVCYTHCSYPEVSCHHSLEVAYNNRCLYQIRSSVKTDIYCKKISSGFSEVVPYGSNKPPDRTLTVVAIVVPIILSVCVLLSCYCFRRHSAIICPTIPDPSAIFKEMMMNGNKDLKTPGSLYTPVPEPIESFRITQITENSGLQQNV